MLQLYILKIKIVLGYMAKLTPMVREFNTSPVAELDVLSHNISVIASELGVAYATPVSTVSFVRAIGDGNEFTVTVDAVSAESKAGVATLLVDRDSDVEYTISAAGFEDITGTLYVSDVNVQVLLPRFVDAGLDGKFFVTVSAIPSGATVSLNSKSGSLEMSVSQAANEATYGDVSVVVGAIADIPASGGEAVVGDVTCTQAVSYTSGASSENSIEDYTVSSPLPSASDLSTTVKERTKVGTVTVTATGQGDKSGTGSADVYQAANVATYGDATVSLTYPDIPAEGGSVNPNALTGTQSVSYTSGASESDVFEVEGSPVYSGTNVDPSTGTVTAEATESASRTLITTASVSVQSHGKTATASAEVYQAAKTE